jgi:hypothetical protein
LGLVSFGYCGIDRSRKEHSQWIGLSNKDILERFHDTFDNIVLPMKMEEYLLPKFPGKMVIVGDLIREVVVPETCYIQVRSFSLEQFLHGPRVTIDRQSSLLVAECFQ